MRAALLIYAAGVVAGLLFTDARPLPRIGLALAWGSSFVFIKTALTDGMEPLTLVTYRLAIGTAFLLADQVSPSNEK